MKRKLSMLVILLAVFTLLPLQAKKVEPSTAELVAKQLVSATEPSKRNSLNLRLVHTELQTANQQQLVRSATKPTYYVFSKGDNQGIVIISADDVAVPVLGYTESGNYDPNNLPINFEYWMQEKSAQISYAIDNQLEQDAQTQKMWDDYLKGNIKPIQNRATVAPLVKTKWDQNAPFNLYTPTDTPTGCVATAMAQIMKHHNHPASRAKEIPAYVSTTMKYNIPAIPASQYDWANMTNTYDASSTQAQNDAVATIMYHAGASVQMDYTPQESGAFTTNAALSFINYFNYDTGIQLEYRDQYEKSDWEAIIINEINQNRPVYYSGSGTGGHAWVCDGYNDSGYFHMNWGWGGYQDGEYAIDALAPGIGGTGSGSGSYNNDQTIITGIKPFANGVNKFNLILKEEISLSKTTLKRGENFNIENFIYNLGLYDFNGYVGSVIVDEDDNIIAVAGEYIFPITGPTYDGIYSGSGIHYKTNVIPTDIEPGEYYVKIVAKEAESADWTFLKPNAPYADKVPITITESTITHNIRIFRQTTLHNTATSVKANEEFTVSAQFANFATTTFTGNFGVALVDDQDNILEVVGTFRLSGYSTFTLNSYTLANPMAALCTISTAINPGNYSIRTVARPTGEDWSIVYAENSTAIAILPLEVTADPIPATSTWAPQASSTNWADAANWTNGLPGATTKVTIPADASSYPTITEATAVDIIYIGAGAELRGQDLLTYNKAFVDYDFGTDPNRSIHFRSLSIPLMEVYHSDFTFGGKPNTYLQTLQVDANGRGKWITLGGGNVPAFTAGSAFTLSLDPDNSTTEGLGLAKGILRLPYFDTDSEVDAKVHPTHSYEGNWSSKFYNPNNMNQFYTIKRSPNAYKLAGAEVNVPVKFGLSNSLQLALVGNPFVTTIDFHKLYEDNSSLIKSYYQVWTKVGITEGYIGYSITDGEFGLIPTKPMGMNQYIAPMQGFIVEQNGNATGNLNFNLNSVTADSKGELRNKAQATNKITIIARNSDAAVSTYIAKREYGSENFGNADVRKLMNELTAVPEIYTLKSSDKGITLVGANITNGNDVEYPIGIATAKSGQITLTFSGMDSYNSERVLFVDKMLNKTIDITGLDSYDYTFNYNAPVVNGEAVPTNDRFVLRTVSATSSIQNELDNDSQLVVSDQNGFINISAGSANTIQEVSVYNLNGMLIYRANVNASAHITNQTFPKGVYIIKINIDNNFENLRISIK